MPLSINCCARNERWIEKLRRELRMAKSTFSLPRTRLERFYLFTRIRQRIGRGISGERRLNANLWRLRRDPSPRRRGRSRGRRIGVRGEKLAAGNGIKSATVRPPPSRGSSRKKLCTWQLLMPRRKILSYPAFPVLLPRLLSLFQRFPPRTFFTHTCISLDNNDSPALNFTRRGVHGSPFHQYFFPPFLSISSIPRGKSEE